jgi:hypothetical protein
MAGTPEAVKFNIRIDPIGSIRLATSTSRCVADLAIGGVTDTEHRDGAM